MILQKTLKKSVSLKGIGLHSGLPITLNIHAARPGRGIVFIRTDLPRTGTSAHYKNITNTQLATTIGRGNVTVSTVEHVMAALYGMDVDNAIVEVSGAEVPILDGSSVPF